MLVLLLSGCLYGTSMFNGKRLENSGDLAKALEHYEKAVGAKPESDDAVEARNRVRQALVEGYLDQAANALALKDYEKAVAELAKAGAYDRDSPEVFEMTSQARGGISQDYQRAWSNQEYVEAYDLAIRAQKLFPESDFLDKAFEDLRAHFLAQARDHQKAKRYEEALESLDVIRKREPSQEGQTLAPEKSIRRDWSADLAAQAQRYARARKPGAAAATWARAYEVGDLTSHLNKARDVLREIAQEGPLKLALDVKGDDARVEPVRSALATGMAKITETETADARRADLVVSVGVPKPTCTEDDSITPTEKEYIKDRVQEPNPEYGELTKALADERKAAEAAGNRADALLPSVTKAEEALREVDERVSAAKADYENARSAVDTAKDRLERTRAQSEPLKAQLAEHQASGNTHAAEGVRMQLADIAKIEREWGDEVIAKTSVAEEKAGELRVLEKEREPIATKAEELKKTYDELFKARNDANAKASELSGKLSTTDKMMWVDIPDVLKYDVHDTVRTCAIPLSARFRSGWESNLPASTEYAPVEETKDRWHIGHEKAQVEEDKKLFPETDAQLVTKADDETIKAVLSDIYKLVDEHFEQRRQDVAVEMASNPVDATTEVLRLLHGTPGRLEDADKQSFLTHLKTNFGLEKPELLTLK